MKIVKFEVNPRNANSQHVYIFAGCVAAVEDSARSGHAMIYLTDGKTYEVKKSAAAVVNELGSYPVCQD